MRRPLHLVADPGEVRPLRPHQGNARKMSAGDLRETMIHRVDLIRIEMVERISEALNRNNQLAQNLKDYETFRDSVDKRLFDFARRLTAIEAKMKRSTPEHPGSGNWRLPLDHPVLSNSPTRVEGNRAEGGRRAAPRDELAEYENRPRPRIASVPDYTAMRAEAAAKAGKELPETVSTAELAKYFGCSPWKAWSLATHGEIRVIRKGRLLFFPRKEIVEYIRSRGLPSRKTLHYGAGGIREIT